MTDAQKAPAPSAAAAVAPPGRVEKSITQLTGLQGLDMLKVAAFDRPWATKADHAFLRSPTVKPDYDWDREQLMTLIALEKSGARAIKLVGHTGTGKTELVTQWMAVRNIPLQFLIGTEDTRASSMIGCLVPSTNGQFRWQDGPITAACRYGLPVLIDEYNNLDPGECTGLNSFLEGRPYTIPETNETVMPRPGFVVYATINPKTDGYQARKTMDLANDDRFVKMYLGYPDPAVEVKFLTQIICKAAGLQESVATPMAESFVRVANEIRQRFMGESSDASAFTRTISRRSLKSWVLSTLAFQSFQRNKLLDAKEPAVQMALRAALTGDMEPAEARAIQEIVTLHMGTAAATSSSGGTP